MHYMDTNLLSAAPAHVHKKIVLWNFQWKK